MSNYKNILLVEDDIDDQDLFIEVLPRIDASIAWAIAANGVEALQTLESLLPEMPDLIFLDLNMPKMNGQEFMHVLQHDAHYARFRNIPIVILTTTTTERERCFKLGACLCLEKPATIQAYRMMLITVLDNDVIKDRDHLRHLFG